MVLIQLKINIVNKAKQLIENIVLQYAKEHVEILKINMTL